mmetsp:Transcript_20944/g.47267  ORF Transcript_20944/g.47267 Transcript_20944/m.47267 type:complete len:285 (+) Transcript_20944:390-1244(+)
MGRRRLGRAHFAGGLPIPRGSVCAPLRLFWDLRRPSFQDRLLGEADERAGATSPAGKHRLRGVRRRDRHGMLEKLRVDVRRLSSWGFLQGLQRICNLGFALAGGGVLACDLDAPAPYVGRPRHCRLQRVQRLPARHRPRRRERRRHGEVTLLRGAVPNECHHGVLHSQFRPPRRYDGPGARGGAQIRRPDAEPPPLGSTPPLRLGLSHLRGMDPRNGADPGAPLFDARRTQGGAGAPAHPRPHAGSRDWRRVRVFLLVGPVRKRPHGGRWRLRERGLRGWLRGR